MKNAYRYEPLEDITAFEAAKAFELLLVAGPIVQGALPPKLADVIYEALPAGAQRHFGLMPSPASKPSIVVPR